MNYPKGNLSKQLLFIIVIVFAIVLILLGVVLPKTLIPVAEQNIYSYLSEPLKLMQSDFSKNLKSSEVAYLYIIDDQIVVSDNLYDVVAVKKPEQILKKQQKIKENLFLITILTTTILLEEMVLQK